MAFVVGKDDKKKQDGMNILGSPGSFANIKSQLQSQQLQQPIQSMKDAPAKKQDEEKKKRFAHGGVVQHFQNSGVAGDPNGEYEEDEVDLYGQSRTGGGGVTGRGIESAAPQQRSGAFTGIQDYVTANKPKIEEISGKISGGIAGEAGEIRDKAGQAQEKYLGEEGLYTGGEDFVTGQISGAGTEEQSAEDAARFQGYRLGSDKGPNLQESLYDARQLEGRADRLGSAGGRFAELQRLVGKESGGYSPGQRRFDQLLLAGDPESRIKSIREARGATEGLSSGVSDVAGDIGAQRTTLMKTAQDKADAARKKQREGIEALRTNVGESFGAEGDYALSTEDLAKLGIDEGVGELYGTDVGKYLTSSGITPKQQARIQALSKLSGSDPTISTDNAYDVSGLQEEIARRKGLYDPELATRQAAEQAATSQYNTRRDLALPDSMAGMVWNRDDAEYNLRNRQAQTAARDAYARQVGGSYQYQTNDDGGQTGYTYGNENVSRRDPRFFTDVNKFRNYSMNQEQANVAAKKARIDALNKEYNIGKGIGVEQPPV